MRQATLDLLDAELRKGHTHYTGSSAKDRILFYRRELRCDPTCWTALYAEISRYTLIWQEFRYRDALARNDIDTQIPSNDPGLYIFYVRPEDLLYQFPRLPLYVGISNATGTNRPLRERLKEYMNLGTVKKRNNVHQMLQLYYDHVWVAYSHLSIPSSDMLQLETNIHDFLCPPFGRSAYSLSVKASQRAWDV